MSKPKQENKELKEKTRNGSAAPVSNPAAKNSVPSPEIKKRGSAVKRAAKNSVKTEEKQPNNLSPVDNPIIRNREIVAKINTISPVKTTNKLYGGYLNNTLSPIYHSADYVSVLRDLNTALQNKTTLNDLFSVYNSTLTEKLLCRFVAFGVFHEKSKCLNLKLTSTLGSTYSSRFSYQKRTILLWSALQTHLQLLIRVINF